MKCRRATIKVDGEYAFGYAKAKVGVHRLVRISPSNGRKRRHASLAAVAVVPILDDTSTRYHINESDLGIEWFCAGGAGGQHVNTTESAVRIVHIPTGELQPVGMKDRSTKTRQWLCQCSNPSWTSLNGLVKPN